MITLFFMHVWKNDEIREVFCVKSCVLKAVVIKLRVRITLGSVKTLEVQAKVHQVVPVGSPV